MSYRISIFVLFVLMSFLAGCGVLDRYQEKFTTQISTGDTREKVVSVLGSPDTSYGIEIPVAKVEQMAWRSVFTCKTYVVYLVAGRVVGKISL